MHTLLIGWELGAGAGHIHRLVPIIAHYLKNDWKVVSALRQRHAAEAYFSTIFPGDLADGRLIIVQAPIFLHRRRSMRSSSLAELFAQIGFAEHELLGPVARSWERLLAIYQPDAIISDFAPCLNLAAAGRATVTVIGNGWTVPPDTERASLFDQRSGAQEAADQAALRVAETASRVTGGRYQSSRFSSLLRGTHNLVCTLGALDPYARQRREPYFWPFEIPPGSQREKVRTEQGIIYLPRGHPMLPVLFRAISTGVRQFAGYLGGDLPVVANLLVSPIPIDLTQALPRSVLAIHHGGLGTAIGCWAQCVPQIVLPMDSEKMIVGHGLQRSGAGMIGHRDAGPKRLAALIERAALLSVERPDCSGMMTTNPEDTLAALSVLVG